MEDKEKSNSDKFDGETSELTSDKISEFAIVIEQRLAKTLSGQIEQLIKPLNQSRVDYLEEELKVANYILMELQDTMIGWWALKKVQSRIKKQADKIVEEEKLNSASSYVKTILGAENYVEEDKNT